MFKKIVEFFTGKKPESKYAHPLDAVTTPTVSAPYKLEPPAATTPLVYHPMHPACLGPIPVKVEPPVDTTPVLVNDSEPVVAPEKKKRTFVKKPVVVKAPAAKASAKPRAKKTPQ